MDAHLWYSYHKAQYGIKNVRHGVPLPVISESLGHSNQNSAMIYITTDDIKLSGCTLPLPCWKEGMIVNDKSVSLRDLATAFVLYKQSLGYVYNTQVHYLLKYISFSENRYPECQVPCKDAVNEFLANVSDRKGSLYGIVCALREFSRYLILRGYSDAYLIPAKTTSQPVAEPPYFFIEAEIIEFFNALDKVTLHGSSKVTNLCCRLCSDSCIAAVCDAKKSVFFYVI